jgi:glycosyltransferase involved in cell wall biosynthesis
MADVASPGGKLDGKTIFRFSHGFDHGGGLEQYVDDLNSVLSARNRIHTIQLRLTTGSPRREILEMNGSKLTTFFVKAENYQASHGGTSLKLRLINRVRNECRDRILYQTTLNRLLFRRRLAMRPAPRGIADPQSIVECTRQILHAHKIDLAVLHSFGNRDSQLVLGELRALRVPAALVNHFSNDRLANSSAREQVYMADAIGAVSKVGMPAYLGDRCVYLGDGIDTDFFKRSLAIGLPPSHDGPRIFLPARLVQSKGHLDLIEAAGLVKRQGIPLHLYFAGREDSAEYAAQIRGAASAAGLDTFVHIVGPQNRGQLRDWYAGSLATALPSSHHEGLPRILLESQAMEVPCIAYDIGGVREGFIDRHTGVLVPLGNVPELARALADLARSDDRRREMGSHGRTFVEEHFSFRALAERHESFLLALKFRKGDSSTL